MTLTRWLGLGFVAALGVTCAAFMLTRDQAGEAVDGVLPGVCAGAEQSTIAHLPGDVVKSEVQRITVRGERALLLGLHTWVVVDEDVMTGPFGSRQPGAPGYIANAQDGVVTDSAVYILDTGASSVLRFSLRGKLVGKTTLRPSADGWWQPRQLLIDGDAALVVALEPYGAQPRWSLLRWANAKSQPERIYSTDGTSLSGIVASADHGTRALTIARTQEYAVISVSRDGEATPLFTRRDPPRVPFSRDERRRYRAYFARLPAALQPAYALPPAMPSVVEIKRLDSSRFAAAILATPDSAHIEIVDARGQPVCRATRQPVPLPVALSNHGALWVSEDADEIILRRASYGHANPD